jgi:hypothetical protein
LPDDAQLKYRRHRPQKRMIQYSSALMIDRKAAAYWTSAFAGMTASIFCGLCSNYEAVKNSLSALAVASGFSSVRK